jgi:ketosteroid isomerase-like protein
MTRVCRAGRFATAVLLLLPLAVAAEPAPPPSDPLEIAREEVRAAEIAFAGSLVANDRAKFAAMIADDAVFLDGGGASRGRAEIVAGWEPFFASDAPEFLWHPEIVEISGGGTLGLTRGPWTMKGIAKDGTPIDRKGIFTSIWKKQADGSWRVTFDAGCPPCPVCGG